MNPNPFDYEGYFNSHPWIFPWKPSTTALDKRLKVEIHIKHPLHGLTANVVARRIDNDDILVYLPGHHPPLAVVHLTWTRTPRYPKAEIPWTIYYNSVTDWETSMKDDHDQWLNASTDSKP